MILINKELKLTTVIRLLLGTSAILFSCQSQAIIKCGYVNGALTYTIDESRIVVPLDLPNGTVIYRQPERSTVRYTNCHVESVSDGSTYLGLKGGVLNTYSYMRGIRVGLDLYVDGAWRGETDLATARLNVQSASSQALTCSSSSCNSVSGSFGYRYVFYKDTTPDFSIGSGASISGSIYSARLGNYNTNNPSVSEIRSLAIDGLNNFEFVECGVTLVNIPTINFGTIYSRGEQADITEALVSKPFSLSYNKQCNSGDYKLRVNFLPVIGSLSKSNSANLIPAGNDSVMINLRDGDNNNLLKLDTFHKNLFPNITGSGTYSKNMKAELLWNPAVSKANRHAGEFTASLDVEVTYY
ncbi:MAG: fimbrial protein [Enterobacteriaceae bacterium]|jgi:type 1 fimbria pilin|nr:fimbrial protein [Enterobacteriaceae bacterium]